MHWSLMDNYEWADGYTQKFGLAEVDFGGTLNRRPRASARLYGEIARANALGQLAIS
jgi:beta-glucosidase